MKTVLAFLCLALPLHAQMFTYESFEGYAAGVQVETGANGSSGTGLDGGAGWGGAYNVNNAIKSLVKIEDRTTSTFLYNNGAIALEGGVRALRFSNAANGVSALIRPLASAHAAGAPLFFSVLFRTTNTSPLPDQDFFQLGFDDNAGGSSGIARVSIGANVISTAFPPNQPFRFFARSTTLTTNSVFDNVTEIQGVTTYLLVAKFHSSTGATFDRVSLFVNPSTLSEPALPSAFVAVDSGLATLAHFFIRTVNLDASDTYVIDELRVGGDFTSVVNGDGDFDGMPDRWEEAHSFDPLNAADAALDADGDGQTNLTEYRAGTDPRDGTSLFSITNLAADAGSIVLTWRSAPGRRYHVQSSDDLAVWTVLSDSGAPVVIDAASGNTTTFPVTTAPGTEHRFYRIELLP